MYIMYFVVYKQKSIIYTWGRIALRKLLDKISTQKKAFGKTP